MSDLVDLLRKDGAHNAERHRAADTIEAQAERIRVLREALEYAAKNDGD